ncbi:MAG: dicarboxylate/amino acid:cation symporter [Spirochaetota bacterium]
MNGTVLLALIGFVLLLAFLVMLRKVWHVPFTIRVASALVLGVGFGLTVYAFTDDAVAGEIRRWVSLVGYGYIDLLRMLIIPLVPTSIIAGLLRLSNTQELKQMGGRTIGLFLSTAVVAGIIGLVVGTLFSVGVGAGAESLAERDPSTVGDLLSRFRDFIPSNPVQDAAETNMIPIVVFSLFVGVAAIMVKGKNKETTKPFEQLLESFLQIVLMLTKIIIRLTPYGVLGLTAYWLSNSGIAALAPLGIFVLAIIFACFLQLSLVYGSLLAGAVRINPLRFYRAASPALLLAFTSRSSLGSLTMTITTMTERLKVKPRVANFVGPIGAVMNMDACGGIFPAMVSVFAANAFGIDLTAVQYVLIVGVSVIASIGSAAVPMGATAFTVITLTTVGLPVEAVGLVAGVDFLVDMFRTATNVAGDMTASVVVGNSLGAFDRKAFNEQDLSAEPA